MIPSILQLKEHVFLKTNISLNKDFDINKEYSVKSEYLSCKIETAYIEQDDCYVIELALDIKQQMAKKANLPYTLHLVSSGIVTLEKSFQGDREKMAVVNGSSLIYSSMREYLMFLTSRYPFGSLLLPTANFQGLAKTKS